MKKRLMIALCSALIIVCAAGGWLLSLVHTAKTSVSTDLSALNLPDVHVYRDLSMQCGEGVFAYVMPWYERRDNPRDLRADAMEAIAAAEGWHVEPVSAAAFSELLQACQVSIPLLPAADAVYDAWFFRHECMYPEKPPTQRPADQWTLCFFDQDNGTWITLTQADTTQNADALPLSALGLVSLEGRLGTLSILRQDTPISLATFEVPAALRGDLLHSMESSGLWQECSIPSWELSAKLDRLQEEVWPCLYPAAEVTADWCYQQDRAAAWYDADTGLFIYYEYDY